MTNATPRPWKREQSGKGSWIGVSEAGMWAALACGETDQQAAANADLIVQAVNEYDDLKRRVEELETALTEEAVWLDARGADVCGTRQRPNAEVFYGRASAIRRAMAKPGDANG